MKKLIVLTILASLPAFALKSRQVQFSAGNPLPSSYDASNQQSLVLSEISRINKNLWIVATANDVVCNLGGDSSVVAPTQAEEIYLVASEPVLLKDVGALNQIYCKGNGTTKTAGWLSVTVY